MDDVGLILVSFLDFSFLFGFFQCFYFAVGEPSSGSLSPEILYSSWVGASLHNKETVASNHRPGLQTV